MPKHSDDENEEICDPSRWVRGFAAFRQFLRDFGLAVALICFGCVCLWKGAPWIAENVVLPELADRRAINKAQIKAIEQVAEQGDTNTANLSKLADNSDSIRKANWEYVKGQGESHDLLRKLVDASESGVREQKRTTEVLEQKQKD